jgi:Saxitoxin biosynthesis operon protein SxtJ
MAEHGGFHEDFTREEKIKGSSDRGFGLVFAAFFALIGALAIWKENPRWILWVGLAATFLLLALVWPGILRPLNRLWTMLGLFLFKIISPLTLGVIYFGVMTPMSLLIRWRDKDMLRRKYNPGATSYWIQRDPPGPEPETMKNQF